MSSHSSFLNTDVLKEVFSHLPLLPEDPADFRRLDADKDVRANRNTLVSAALTCQAFAQPASETLWAVLHKGFFHILAQFTSFDWSKRACDVSWLLLPRLLDHSFNVVLV